MQNSDYKGQRHVNEKVRGDVQKRKEYEEWRAELNQIVEEGRKEREAKQMRERENDNRT